MRRGLLEQWCSCTFPSKKMPPRCLSGISTRFQALFRSARQIAHVLLTRPPLTLRSARLACIRHAASVRPEPGSNSQIYILCSLRALCVSLTCSVFKEPLVFTHPRFNRPLFSARQSLTELCGRTLFQPFELGDCLVRGFQKTLLGWGF